MVRHLQLGVLCLLGCEPGVELRVCSEDPDEESNSIQIESDAELEALRGCRVIEANLRISGSVSSLEPLRHLERVDRLSIHETDELVDLHGLESLRSTGSLNLANNAVLQTLDGLAAASGIHLLSVHDNPQLRSVAGLARLQLSGFESGDNPDVRIEYNPMLADFEGLASLLERAPAPVLQLETETPLDLELLTVRSDYFKLLLIGRGFTNFEALAALRSAHTLSFDNTELRDLQPLRNLESLDTLSVKRSEAFVSVEGINPGLELDWLSFWDLPNLSSVAGFAPPVSFYLRLDRLPLLDDASDLRLLPNAVDGRGILMVEDCPALTRLPQLEGEGFGSIEIRRTGVTDLDDIATITDVRSKTIIWANPQLDQAHAEAWAAEHTTDVIRIGDNLGWVEPEECPWSEDGFCDAPAYCDADELDCNPPAGS